IINPDMTNRTMTYDYKTGIETLVDERGIVSVKRFDLYNNVLSHKIQDRFGDTAWRHNYEYDALNRKVTETDIYGNITGWAFDSLGNEKRITYPETEHFNSDGTSDLKSAYVEFTYDSGNRKTGELRSNGSGGDLISFSYDNAGRMISQTVSYTDIDGITGESISTYSYDENGNVLEKTIGDSRTTYEYWPRNQVKSETIHDGTEAFITTYTYDEADRVDTMTDPRGNSGKYPYGDFSLIYHYDDLGRLDWAKLPKMDELQTEKPVISFNYDDVGNLVGRTEPDGGYTINSFNSRRQLTRQEVFEASGSKSYVTEYYHDAAGNVIEEIRPGGDVYTFSYDELGNQVSRTLPNGSIWRNNYDYEGRLYRTISPLDLRTYYSYDNMGRLISEQNPEYEITNYRYDEKGNLVQTVDAAGEIFTTIFDERGLVLREENSSGKIWNYTYDEAGNVLTIMDPRGTVSTYTYNDRNLADRIDYVNEAEGKTGYRFYIYDEAGQVISAEDNGVITAMELNPYGLVTNATRTGSGRDVSIDYTYDEMMRRTSLSYTDSDILSYNYNSFGELLSIPGYIDNNPVYNDRGHLTGYELANGMVYSLEYDINSRLKDLDYSSDNGKELLHNSYLYNRDDLIIGKNQDYYSYFGNGRLMSAMVVGSVGVTEYEPDMSMGYVKTASEDVLGTKPVTISGDEVSIDHDAGSLVVNIGYPYNVSRIEINADFIDSTLVDERTLQLYTGMYNTEEGYERTNALITVDGSLITIVLEEVTFARYFKLHSTIHELDEDGKAMTLSQLIAVNPDNITV
ncbi:MAG: RHS repeat protein, partial [Spirochaetaceae bacterium]|nr:RHS repeat protein [Spirochaetaceae bacterium]